MKLKLASLALLAFAATLASAQTPAPAADLQKTLLASSTSLFTAYQQMDQGLFLSIIAPDFVYVSRWGIMGPDELGGAVQACSMTAFKLTEPKARQLSPDTAVLLYKAHQTATCNGKPEPADLVLTDTFVKKGNDWLMTVHTQTATQTATQAATQTATGQ
jgi:hypothetical protein